MSPVAGHAPARDFMRPGRSPVRSLRAMAATSSPLATEAALQLLRDGGNAVDAAIGACAVLALVEPHQTGLGGDCFALIARNGTDRVVAYNGSGRAPARIDRAEVAGRMPGGIQPTSPEAVTIPGAVEAWIRLSADHGRLPLSQALAPAIAYAEHGVVLQDRVAFDWGVAKEKIAGSPVLAASFFSGGQPPRPGTVLRYPELARTFRLIAEKGREGFYEGSIARSLVATLRASGGVHELDDFADHRGEYVAPMNATFRGYTVHQCPPNGQGVIALLIMRILEQLETDPDGPLGLWRLHAITEAARQAFALRNARLGDPNFTDFDWSSVLEPPVIAGLAARIRPDARIADQALPTGSGSEHRDTTYLCVVDEDRNAVSLINSLFESFGSTITDPQSGITLHNRGLSFSLLDGHPNALAPGKRPMHTIIPGMLTKAGRVVMPFGVMGGHFQPVGHALLLSHMLDYGLDLQTAVDLPRLFPSDGKLWVESGINHAARQHLSALGHDLTDRIEPAGGAQAIWIDHTTGVLTGASDPRKDGAAIGY
ncbi:gamma-glutamyltransferase family protein [Prosthecomicrobium sp. N25]|uniref:gamma-glutamyltransferase family protein n=1 Tax=Prosthecomicrobium sp. N25 TaxID=3129254 RepID=UPI003077F604